MNATALQWPSRDEVIAALGPIGDRGGLDGNWVQALIRLRQRAEEYTALAAARELVTREHKHLTGEPETPADPTEDRPSGWLAVNRAIEKLRGLETEALYRYVALAQASVIQVATGRPPAVWHRLDGEEPQRDHDGRVLTPEDPSIPEPLARAAGGELVAAAVRQFDLLSDAEVEYEDLFGCDDRCDEYEDGCSGGPHVPEHMIETESELLEELGRQEEYFAAFADAVAWTLAGAWADRLRKQAS